LGEEHPLLTFAGHSEIESCLNAEGFSVLTSGRIVGHLESLVFPQNDAANQCNPHRPALVAKERHNGAAERSSGRIMPGMVARIGNNSGKRS
jgi:hypothetical protein